MTRDCRHINQSTRWTHHVLERVRGLCLGAAMLAGAVGVLWWNEQASLRTLRSLSETAELTEPLPPGADPAALDGKVVCLSGDLTLDAPAVDAALGVSADAVLLRRRVEVMQWRERIQQITNQTSDGPKVTELPQYDRRWSAELIDSSGFVQSGSHVNPPEKPIGDAHWFAPAARVEGVVVPHALLDRLTDAETLVLQNEDWRALPASVRQAYVSHDGMLHSSAYPSAAQVGDVRISYEAVRPTRVTVVGRLNGGVLSAHHAEAGESVALLTAGDHDVDAMFDAAYAAAPRPGWLMRGLGLAAAVAGAMLLLKPFAEVSDRLPVGGGALRRGFVLPASVAGLASALSAIAAPWLTFRPVFAGVTVLAAAASVYWLYTVLSLPAADFDVPDTAAEAALPDVKVDSAQDAPAEVLPPQAHPHHHAGDRERA